MRLGFGLYGFLVPTPFRISAAVLNVQGGVYGRGVSQAQGAQGLQVEFRLDCCWGWVVGFLVVKGLYGLSFRHAHRTGL